MTSHARLPPPLPHAHPFRLIDRQCGAEGDEAPPRAITCLSASATLARRGADGFPPYVALELLAQGALVLLRAEMAAADDGAGEGPLDDGAARPPALAGFDRVQLADALAHTPLRPGDRLVVSLRGAVRRLGPLRRVHAVLQRADADDVLIEGHLLLA
ncbi:MAG: hypothetical protein AAF772_13380 [Acidobacteriota bacterium]